jgi:CO/xanthine dehydrogenase Mo-binding subunit
MIDSDAMKMVRISDGFGGESAARLDGVDKVTGHARYTADVILPGMLYGRCLRSPYPSARILSIDVTRARQLPGVHAVLTGSDVPDTLFGKAIMDIPILAKGIVRFAGEKVAAVAAESLEIADAALALIDVEYEELPFVTNAKQAMDVSSHRVHDRPAKFSPEAAARVHGELRMYPPVPNVVSQLMVHHGDAEKAFVDADRIFEHEFEIPSVHQGYLEPHSCLVALNSAGDVDVWISNKGPHIARDLLAETLGLPAKNINLHPVMIGGDFGGKGGLMDAPLCYYLALHSHRPVKMVMTYFEELTAANPRHSATIALRTSLDLGGRILGMMAKMIFSCGAYAGFCPIVSLHGYVAFAGSYRVPNCSLEVLRVHTNTVPAGHMRGPGGPQITFAVESHLDMIAHELQIDPYEFRRQNAIVDGDPSPIGEMRKSINCVATIDAAMGKWNWKSPKPANVGRGIALYEYPPGTFGLSSVTLRIDADAAINVSVGAPDTGTGFHTIVAQLTAEHLGVSPNEIKVVHKDTHSSGYERGASASRLTTTIDEAIRDAATKAKAVLVAIAAEHFGCAEEAVAFSDRMFSHEDRSIGLKELMVLAAARDLAPIIRDGKNVSRAHSDVTCFAAQMAEVEVDRETGQVLVKRIVTAHDVGKIVNPLTHQGQIEGGVIQGLGQAMCEQLQFRDGAVVSASLGDYKLPCIMDVPELETVLVSEANGGGMVKSIAEVSNAAVIAAISNAVYDAVGVRLKELPLSAERVYNALRSRVQSS